MTTTTTAIVIMLIVLFGAGLMGKMLKDLYPGTLFGGQKKTSNEDMPAAE
jgi:hypothetical protein